MTDLQLRALGPTLGSIALLLAAFGFQYLGGLAPCHLCLLQRWPHGVAIVLGLLILLWPARGLALLAGLAVLVSAAIGGYHVGVEEHWWAGPASCTAAAPAAGDAGALLDRILATPTVLCDAVAWRWLGISMAGWNGILSLVLAGLWLRAYASSSASQ